MPRQYIECQFRIGDIRTYAYANDGEPVVEGDQVEVETKKGKTVVRVVKVGVPAPTKFEAKAIIGKHVPPPVD